MVFQPDAMEGPVNSCPSPQHTCMRAHTFSLSRDLTLGYRGRNISSGRLSDSQKQLSGLLGSSPSCGLSSCWHDLQCPLAASPFPAGSSLRPVKPWDGWAVAAIPVMAQPSCLTSRLEQLLSLAVSPGMQPALWAPRHLLCMHSAPCTGRIRSDQE